VEEVRFPASIRPDDAVQIRRQIDRRLVAVGFKTFHYDRFNVHFIYIYITILSLSPLLLLARVSGCLCVCLRAARVLLSSDIYSNIYYITCVVRLNF